MDREQTIRRVKLQRQYKIVCSRDSFWIFCQTLAPEFYKDDRPHLIDLCNDLQAFWEGKLLKPDGTPHKKFMNNIPPRHGKTRTLVLFCMWVFGLCVTTRVIACSYGDDEAEDFSRYTRDGIAAEANMPHHIVYSDIFPKTRIKEGNASYKKWAIEGQHFSYKAAGIFGAITGKGATLKLGDDFVKDALDAYNKKTLDKLWRQYTGTYRSRKEEGHLEVLSGTRWATDDPCGRIQRSSEAGEWYIFSREACDKDDPNSPMLCPEIYSRESYNSDRAIMDEAIFFANYHQQPIDIKGRMYTSIKTYEKVPNLFKQIRCYIDTADTGSDYLCAITYGVYEGEAWITDVLYTKKGMEYTEPEAARLLVDNSVNLCTIEGNNGGRGFARAVKKVLWDKHKTKQVVIHTFHQSKNKASRILSKSNYIMQHIYLPFNWKNRFPNFYTAIMTHQKEGVNEHDDAADAITGVAESIDTEVVFDEINSLSEIGVF